MFSLPIKYEKIMLEYEKNGVDRRFPYCDYEYEPKSDWDYCICDPAIEVERHEISDIPFSSENPPVTAEVKFKKISWGYEEGFESVCAKVPESTTPIGDAETVGFHPSGCAKLRITELPLID